QVLPLHAQLVVGVEVVRRREQRHDPGEALLPDPDDLLLAPHPTVGSGIATGALADRQSVLDDPGEVPGDDPGGPLSFHPATTLAACAVGRTSWTRTMPAPCAMAHVAVATDASRRSSAGAPPVRRPRNDLRLVPTTTGSPVSTSTPRFRRSAR